MILELFDSDHVSCGPLKKYKDLKEEGILSSGQKQLSFSYPLSGEYEIKEEMYVQTDTNEFVIKETSVSKGWMQIIAQINLEELSGNRYKTFTLDNKTAWEAVTLALRNTGWTVKTSYGNEKRRSFSLTNVCSLDILNRIKEAFLLEMKFDSLNKVVVMEEKIGSDKGAYFAEGLNLKELRPKGDTNDYITRLIPIGADDLSIAEVNDGKDYVENYQYSNKIITAIWQDVNYIDAQALKDDAEKHLEEYSKPRKSYSVSVIDLAKLSSDYGILDYGLGDVVTIMSSSARTREKQRIVKITTYPDNPEKNTCELGNTVISFADYQKMVDAAVEVVNNVTDKSGIVIGSKVYITKSGAEPEPLDSILDYDEGRIRRLETDSLTADDLTAINADIDNLKTKKLEAEDLSAINADIDTLKTNDADINGRLNAANANIENLKAKDAEIDKALIKKLDADTANLKYVEIDFTNIGVADIGKFFAKSGIIQDVVTETGTVTGELVGVTIKGDLIEGNTIVAEKLVIKGTDGLFYKLNTDGEHVESEQTEYNALDGKNIIAKSITATKINVSDLVAFGATIAGLIIENGSIHSATKTTVDSAMPGIYMDSKGQFNTGDANNFIASWYDTEAEKWKVVIQSDQIMLGNGQSVTEIVTGAAAKVDNMQQRMDSGEFKGATGPTGPTGATGATGKTGPTGATGADGYMIAIESTNGNIFKNSKGSTTLTARIYQGGTELDTGGTSFAYKWSKYDKNGNKITSFSSSAKSITQAADDVTEKATYDVEVSW